MSETTNATIYVELLDEGGDVWRPVVAVQLSEWVYRIPADTVVPETEMWAFEPGMIVRCERRAFYKGEGLVAVEELERAV